MKLYVNVCSPWSMVELNTRFEWWIKTNDVKDVSLFHISYIMNLMVYLCSHWKLNVQIKYFLFEWSIHRLFVLNGVWNRDTLQIMIFVFVSSTWSIVEQKTRFVTWMTRNDVNGVSLFLLSYLTTFMAYQCYQRAPNVQIMYFMFHCSIYRLFVLNTCWKRDYHQMMIIVNVYSKCNMVELKTSFETWITINDVNGVSLIHLSYLITLMAYLCSHWAPKVQIKYFLFDWSIYRLFVKNWCWKDDHLQIMIFEFVCSTWVIVELKARFDTWINWNELNGLVLFHLSYLMTLMGYLCSQRTPNVQIK
jgi:hypothetical protein